MQPKSNKKLLTPVGKMKGEIDGQFESFYMARDEDGRMYMNRNPEYSENRYEKSKGWKSTTEEQLDGYRKQLHFIPQKARGLKP